MSATEHDTAKKRKVARWRKQPSETGLRSIGQGPRGYELRLDGEELIHVSPIGGGALNGPLLGWYWYGLGRNTYTEREPFKTKEEAKADADAFYKSQAKADE